MKKKKSTGTEGVLPETNWHTGPLFRTRNLISLLGVPPFIANSSFVSPPDSQSRPARTRRLGRSRRPRVRQPHGAEARRKQEVAPNVSFKHMRRRKGIRWERCPVIGSIVWVDVIPSIDLPPNWPIIPGSTHTPNRASLHLNYCRFRSGRTTGENGRQPQDVVAGGGGAAGRGGEAEDPGRPGGREGGRPAWRLLRDHRFRHQARPRLRRQGWHRGQGSQGRLRAHGVCMVRTNLWSIMPVVTASNVLLGDVCYFSFH